MYHNDRDDNMSGKKREEIENEVRSYVVHFPQCPAFLHFTRLFASDDGQGSDGKMGPGSADSIFGFFRILKAGEKRANDLLKEKEGELHRVSNLSPPLSG